MLNDSSSTLLNKDGNFTTNEFIKSADTVVAKDKKEYLSQ